MGRRKHTYTRARILLKKKKKKQKKNKKKQKKNELMLTQKWKLDDFASQNRSE